VVQTRKQVARVQEHVALAKVTATEAEEMLRDWTRQESGRTLTLKVDAIEKSAQLAFAIELALVGQERR
jgi:hypothetical protein